MWSVLEFYARFLALTPLSRMVHRGHSVNELISARFVAPAERPKKEGEREGQGQTQETHTCLLGACVWVCVCAFDTWLPKTKQEDTKTKTKICFY